MIKINNQSDDNYLKKVYEKDFSMITSIVFNSLLNKSLSNINYNKIYRFATEDIASYLKKFGNIKNYLTVCGSSEQVINGILYGAKNIDVFDINYFTKHGLNLRLAAIKALTQDEFITFYNSKFNSQLFFKILMYLDEYNYNFWNKIYNCYGDVLINKLFYNNRLSLSQIISINPYLQNNNYEQIKTMIDEVNINFIESDLYNLVSHISNNKYDLINLSNIYEYLNYDKDTSILLANQFKDYIISLTNNNLNDGGSIIVSYMYKWNRNVKKHFDNLYKINKKLVSRKDGAIKKELYLNGQTYQNLSYSMLYDVLGNKIEEIITNTIIYGMSIEEKHDVAIVLRKNKSSNK